MRIAITVLTLAVSDALAWIQGKPLYLCQHLQLFLYLLDISICFVIAFVLLSVFLPRTHLATPSHAQQTSTHRTSAHTIRETITFSASMLELRLWRNELKCEIRESGREKEMEKTRMKGERAGERAGIHSQVGEKHTCPNPLLLAAVFLSTWKSDVATNPKSLSLSQPSLPPSLSLPTRPPPSPARSIFILLQQQNRCCFFRQTHVYINRSLIDAYKRAHCDRRDR